MQSKTNIELYSLIITGIIILNVITGFIIFFISVYRQKQKANVLLQQKNLEIENAMARLKSAQAQLVQSEKMASLGELTAGIAHEIQNPLNFVNNFAELNNELLQEMEAELEKGNLKEALETAIDIRDNNVKITSHGKRADAIVKGMLEHSRLSSGERERVDLNSLLEEFIRLSYHGIRSKNKTFIASIQTDFDPNIKQVSIIRQDLGRVFLNVLNNAFYFMSEKIKLAGEPYEPKVNISTRAQGDAVEIKIRDNGIGVPNAIIEKIFQPFFTTKPTGQGTGLGLSITYDIIKAHGGKLKVDSKEGEYAEFTMYLPVPD
jgi:two-component system NtrC family sensor kinase